MFFFLFTFLMFSGIYQKCYYSVDGVGASTGGVGDSADGVGVSGLGDASVFCSSLFCSSSSRKRAARRAREASAFLVSVSTSKLILR